MTRRHREVGAGTYILSTGCTSPRLDELRDAIVDKALDLDVDASVEVLRHSDAWLVRHGRDDGIVEFVWSSRAGGELVSEHRALFRNALVRKRAQLDRAGAAGYETVLLIAPAWLGTPVTDIGDFDATPIVQRAWLEAFDGLVDEVGIGTHPQSIWLVSIVDRYVAQVRG